MSRPSERSKSSCNNSWEPDQRHSCYAMSETAYHLIAQTGLASLLGVVCVRAIPWEWSWQSDDNAKDGVHPALYVAL